MKLYTKLNKPKRVRDRNDTNGQVDYKKQYMLDPTEPTEVPDDIAKRILKRDPHIVSKTPLGAKKKNPNEKFRKHLATLAGLDIKSLSNKELFGWGTKLAAKVTQRMPNRELLQGLNVRVDELIVLLQPSTSEPVPDLEPEDLPGDPRDEDPDGGDPE